MIWLRHGGCGIVSSVSVGVDGLQSRVGALIAESGFSGVVRVDRAGETLLERAAGWAHRAHLIPMTVDTRLAMASGSKGVDRAGGLVTGR